MADDSTMDKARALIQATENALADGVKHFNKEGKLLATSKEILECLVREGEVICEQPKT